AANDGTESWAAGSGNVIGRGGWQNYKSVFAGGNGVIYAISNDGNLHWYRDIANDGAESWAAGSGNVIGQGGWQNFIVVSASVNKKTINDKISDLLPVGSVLAFAGVTTPELQHSGWLVCDGKELAIDTHRELFDAIGYANGGNGVTSFNLPDFRGYFLRGV